MDPIRRPKCAGYRIATGAEIDDMSEQDYMQLGTKPPELSPDLDGVHAAAGGGELDSAGVFLANLQLGRKIFSTTVHVFKDLKTSLLSKSSCLHLALLEKNWHQSRLQTIQSLSWPMENHKRTPGPCARDLTSAKRKPLERHSEVFEEKPFKAMQELPMHIELEDCATPCKQVKPRSIPFRWREIVQDQLDNIVQKDVIEKVPVGETQSYQWCHPMVVVPKKDSSQPPMTVDLRGLNKFVKSPACPTRVPREVIALIPRRMKNFTTHDSRHG